MPIDKKYQKELLSFIYSAENAQASMSDIGFHFGFFEGAISSPESFIVIDDELDKFIHAIEFLTDLGLVSSRSQNNGISHFNGPRMVNPKTIFSIPAQAYMNVESLLAPWWKKLQEKIFQESGKIFWAALGAAVLAAVGIIVTYFMNEIF